LERFRQLRTLAEFLDLTETHHGPSEFSGG
jgi:hypothetical protein